MQFISGIPCAGLKRTDRDIPISYSQPLGKCLPNKEAGERRKWQGFYFQPKSYTDRPHTHSLSLLFSLLPAFCTKFQHEMQVCPAAHCVWLETGRAVTASSWTVQGCHREQWKVRGNESLGQLGRGKLGARGEEGEFLWELHSLDTSGYIRSSQRRDQTGTDEGAVKTKKSWLGRDSQMGRSVKEKWDMGNYSAYGNWNLNTHNGTLSKQTRCQHTFTNLGEKYDERKHKHTDQSSYLGTAMVSISSFCCW